MGETLKLNAFNNSEKESGMSEADEILFTEVMQNMNQVDIESAKKDPHFMKLFAVYRDTKNAYDAVGENEKQVKAQKIYRALGKIVAIVGGIGGVAGKIEIPADVSDWGSPIAMVGVILVIVGGAIARNARVKKEEAEKQYAASQDEAINVHKKYITDEKNAIIGD